MAYNFGITFWKGVKLTAYIFLSGLIVVATDYPWLVAAIPLIEMALNWLKHKDDT